MEMNYKQVDVTSVQPVVQGVVQPQYQTTTIQALDVYPVGVEAYNPATEGEAIRDDFIYLLCCAFTCCNFDLSKCFGTRSECTYCCFEYSSICMKCVDDPKACLICQSGGFECVHPRKCYSEYAQCFCFECYAAFPPISGKFKKIHDRPNHTTSNFVPSGDATLCTSALCCLSSCNCRCPSCIGVYVKNVCICVEMESTYYKPMCCTPEKKNKDTLCILFNGHYACVKPYTCCKGIWQWFCIDYRCALPCDEEVPCVYGLCCFCTCCVDWNFLLNCGGTINQIVRASQAKKGGSVHGVIGSGSMHNNTHHGAYGGQGGQGGYNNNLNSSSHGQQYSYQQVQANLGGSPYNHQGSVHGGQGSPYTVQGTGAQGSPYTIQGSSHGSAGQAIQYEQVHTYEPHAKSASAPHDPHAQDEHQYKNTQHSAPPEAQMVVAYEV